MSRSKTLSLLLFLSIVLISCTKPGQTDDPPANPNNPPPPPPTNGKPAGVLYMNIVGNFIKLDPKDSSIGWSTTTINLFGASGNPMTFDSTTFYHGNYGGITAYSAVTGIPRWGFSWIAFNDAIGYREPAFKDSLVFITAPTSEWDHGYLYCLNKRTGAFYWKKQIDAGSVDILFNSTPMVMNDKVIILTRDQNDHKHLTAYKISDASIAWSTPSNDNLSMRLRIVNGKIYSTSGQSIICYDAVDGSLAWQTDLQFDTFDQTASFFEADKLVLVKVKGMDYTIFTLNLADGNVIKRSTLSVPTQFADPKYAPFSSNFRNNTLFVTTHYNFDSVSLRAYDATSLALKWEKRYANYGFSYFTTLQTDKYLVFPINSSYPDGKSSMYFLDFDGNVVTQIPFTANYTDGFVYAENGNTYVLNNTYVAK